MKCFSIQPRLQNILFTLISEKKDNFSICYYISNIRQNQLLS
ncbi:hypothetical protein HMPREF3293_02183 [Christensenella minuta]|uniref:Uncharacterized protein n=1 Tax=Christensenella minuta TaxID=626937 RepID=A0A136Q2N9_9FIRM|nr:hypothetical protein HMPREF3293_02183 [Christensenella minuta]